MPEIREVLARIILSSCMSPGQGYIAARAADALLSEFLVVPRSDIQGTEYGVYGVEGGDSLFPADDRESALRDAAQIREMNLPGMSKLGVVAQAMERPILPWTPITEEPPAPCSDCGLPDGRQSNCLTCHGKPIADAVSEKPEFEVTE